MKIVSLLRSRDKQEEQSLQPSAVGKKLNDLIVQKVRWHVIASDDEMMTA